MIVIIGILLLPWTRNMNEATAVNKLVKPFDIYKNITLK
jgi:hypothetical protein